MGNARPKAGGAVVPASEQRAETWKTGSSQAEARRSALIEWLLLPESERRPRTKREFAEQWGVTTQTLRDDQRHPTVHKTLVDRQRAALKVEKVGEVLASLVDQAVDRENPRSVQAAKVLLDYVGRSEQTDEQVDLKKVSDGDLMDALVRYVSERGSLGTDDS